MATGNVTVVTAANLIPELWSTKTIDFRMAALIFANLVNNDYNEADGFGDKIHIPAVAELPVQAKAAGVAVTYNNNTETEVVVDINKNYAVAVLIEKIVKGQSFVDYQSKLQGQFGYVLGKQVDADLSALVDDFTQNHGTLTVAFTDEEIRLAITDLLNANVPDEGWAFGFSPKAYMALMGIDKYISQDYSLADFPGKSRGLSGMLYRIPVYVSTHVEGTDGAGHDNFLMQREATALSLQQDVEIIIEESADHIGWKIVGSNVFGVKEIRDDHAVWLPGQ